jgi:hypothetical protein
MENSVRQPILGRRVWIARGIAAAVDLVQIGFFPFFIEGSLFPLNAVLDVVTCITLVLLIGWHIAFVPTFIIEQLPIADLAPTWTLATLIATRGYGRKIEQAPVSASRDGL